LVSREKPISTSAAADDLDQFVSRLAELDTQAAKLDSSTIVKPLPKVDVAVVIALNEEFKALQDGALIPTSAKPHQVPGCGHFEYYFTRKTSSGNEYQCVFAVVGLMGELEAALATQSLLHRLSRPPEVIVSAGISGGMHGDVRLADVLAAQSVDRYMANSKAVSKGKKRKKGKGSTRAVFDFEFCGDSEKSTNSCFQYASTISAHRTDLFQSWQRAGASDLFAVLDAQRFETLKKRRFIRESPDVVPGEAACGPSVAGSLAFIQWVKKRSRAFKGIDMESGGVLAAIRRSVDPPKRVLVLRGISDFADERKTQL
jgi:nucleoside phosphorylase